MPEKRSTTFQVAEEIRSKFREVPKGKRQGVQTALAREYGLPIGVVWKIIQNRTYRQELKPRKIRPKTSRRVALTVDQVRDIRELVKSRIWRYHQIAEHYNCSTRTIQSIASRETWKGVE